MEFIAFIGEFQRKEGGFFVNQFEKDFVAFPHGEFEEAFFLDPFEVTLVAHDFVAGPVGADEEVHVLCLPDVGDEGDDAAVAPLCHRVACLLPDLAQHAVFRALPFLELTAYTEPFVVIEVILFLGAVQHQVLRVVFQIAEGGLFHLLVGIKSKGGPMAAFAKTFELKD